MAKPQKTRNGKWRLRAYIGEDADGRKIFQSFTCDTEAACKKAYRDFLKAGGVAATRRARAEKLPTMGEILDAYIEKCEGKGAAYSPSTIRGYRAARRSFRKFEDYPVAKLTIEDLQDYVDLRAQSVCRKTIKNDIYLLKPALDAAKIHLNFTELELPEQEKEEYVIPTDEEIQALIRYFEERGDEEMVVAVVLGAFVGLRRSEVCGLVWEDVDRAQSILHVRHACVMDSAAEYVMKNTKTAAGRRDLILSEGVMAVLKRRILSAGALYRSDEKIISITPGMVSGRFIKARDHLGFRFRFHGLRHYHASIMLALDIPKAYAAADMGHSDFQMIERVYGQIIKEKERATAALVGRHADTLLRGESFSWESGKESS